MHLHLGRHDIACWIHKAYRIDDRHRRAVHFRAINSKFFRQVLADYSTPVKKDRARIGLQIKQPTCGCHLPASVIRQAADVAPAWNLNCPKAPESPESKEGLRLLIDIKWVSPGHAQMLFQAHGMASRMGTERSTALPL